MRTNIIIKNALLGDKLQDIVSKTVWLPKSLTTPAEMLGVNKGKIAVGFEADLLIVTDEDIETVIIGGEVFQ